MEEISYSLRDELLAALPYLLIAFAALTVVLAISAVFQYRLWRHWRRR